MWKQAEIITQNIINDYFRQQRRSGMRGEEGFPLHNEGMMLVNVIWLGREIYTGSQKSGSVTTG